MKTKQIVLFSLLSLLSSMVIAQSMVGFWKVDQVIVGDRNLTPVAKWFRYHSDHTYQAGNGWTQNDTGIWQYDEAKKEFLPESGNGEDEYGPFNVTFSDKKMTWERMEDGMKVVVSLSRTTKMPMSPKDRIAGFWELTSAVEKDRDMTKTHDPENKERIFVRWTGTYRKTNPDGSRSSGYWHMDAHKPEFHMIDFNREADIQVFIISFKDDTVTMKPKEGEGMTFTYKRSR